MTLKALFTVFLSTLLLSAAAFAGENSTEKLPEEPAVAVSYQQAEQVDQLTSKILFKEIELERLNMHFREAVGRQGRWKGWRYFISQQTNFSLSEAGLITATSERMSTIHKPHHPRRQTLEDAAILQMTGSIASSAGSGLEAAINAYRLYRAYKEGLSPGVAKKVVWSLTAEIDRLLAERKELIGKELTIQSLKEHAQLAAVEGDVLADVRFLLAAEYRYFHLDARRLMAFQQSLYLLDIAKRSIAAAASEIGYLSQCHSDRKLNRPIGELATISGAMVIAAPVLSREIGKLSVAYHERRLRLARTTREAVSQQIAKLTADRTKMQILLCQLPGEAEPLAEKAGSRLAHYESVDKEFLDEMNRGLREERAGVLSATENIVAGAITGSTTVVNGILLTRAGYAYSNNGLISNSLLAAGSATALTGNSFALIDNARIQVNREWERHRLAKANQLPNQLIRKRLAELDTAEKQLTQYK